MMLSHSSQQEVATNQQPQEHGNRRRHSVSFKDGDQINEIQSFDDLEGDTLWISRDDIVTYKREMAETLYLYNLKQQCDRPKLDQEEYCLRGIEPLMRKRLSSGRRRIAMSAVFQVQKLQRAAKGQDPEVLAKVYRAYSKSSLTDALVNATNDQQDSFTLSSLVSSP